MPIKFRCSQCGQKYSVKQTLAGRRVTCKNCQEKITVPAEEAKNGRIASQDPTGDDAEPLPGGYKLSDRKSHPLSRFTAEIENHLTKHLGEPDGVFHELASDDIQLDVHFFSPTRKRNWWTLVTAGMSDLPMKVPFENEDYQYAELMLCLPPEWDVHGAMDSGCDAFWPIQQLKQMARFPHKCQTWIKIGDTLPNGDPAEPFHPSTEMCCWTLLPPVWLSDKAQKIPVESEQTSIHLLQLIPLYKSEMQQAHTKGFGGLTTRFDGLGLPGFMLLNRKNVYSENRMSNIWVWAKGRKWSILVGVLLTIAIFNGELSEKAKQKAQDAVAEQEATEPAGIPQVVATPTLEQRMAERQRPSPQPNRANRPFPRPEQRQSSQEQTIVTQTKQPSAMEQETVAPKVQRSTSSTPPSAPASGDEWTPQLGEHLEAKWGSRWYPAIIIDVEADGKFRIHFTKYADSNTSFDESVMIDRLRPAASKQATKTDVSTESTGDDAGTWKPKLNELVEAKWGSRWYPAKIIRVEDGGKFRIHFTKYADSNTGFDESVTLQRLRKPMPE